MSVPFSKRRCPQSLFRGPASAWSSEGTKIITVILNSNQTFTDPGIRSGNSGLIAIFSSSMFELEEAEEKEQEQEQEQEEEEEEEEEEQEQRQ